MASIDLYEDFNEELDARAGDNDEEDGDNRQDSGGEGGSDKNDGDKQNVETKVKIVRKRKLAVLNAERLKGDRGIIAVEDFYKDMKFRGKGYEKQDLDDVMKRLEHWAHR
jgi:TIMELESS-interacting protein